MIHKAILTLSFALSIAMLGATFVVLYAPLQAEAAKSGVSSAWCYADHKGSRCFDDHGECKKFRATDTQAQTGCFKSES